MCCSRFFVKTSPFDLSRTSFVKGSIFFILGETNWEKFGKYFVSGRPVWQLAACEGGHTCLVGLSSTHSTEHSQGACFGLNVSKLFEIANCHNKQDKLSVPNQFQFTTNRLNLPRNPSNFFFLLPLFLWHLPSFNGPSLTFFEGKLFHLFHLPTPLVNHEHLVGRGRLEDAKLEWREARAM